MFSDNIKSLAAGTHQAFPLESSNTTVQIDRDPFELTFREFLNLPSALKRFYREKAYSKAKRYLRKQFDDGHVWVLLCGSGDATAMVASKISEIPNSREVAQIAFEKNRAPYQFSAPMGVDDLASERCEGNHQMPGYPTITLAFQKPESKANIHFDTGAHVTFLNFEYINEVCNLDELSFPIQGWRGISPFEYITEEIAAKATCQTSKNSKMITINALVVKNWKSSPFNVFCHSGCSRFEPGTPKTCVNRSCGLLGR